MAGEAVAVVGALLLAIIMSTALGAMTLVAAIERRASNGYGRALALRGAAEGAAALTAEELAAADWAAALTGGGSGYWSVPAAGFDTLTLTSRLRAEAMSSGAHAADTPFWQVFLQSPWADVTGHATNIAVVAWVADDWAELDGRTAEDSNGLILVRAVAKEREAEAWVEVLYGRGAGGRLRARHIRAW